METKLITELSSLLKGQLPESIDILKAKFQELEMGIQKTVLSYTEFEHNLIGSTLAINEMSSAMTVFKGIQDSIILSAETVTGQLFALQGQVNITMQSTTELSNANSSFLSTLSESIGLIESTYNVLNVLTNTEMKRVLSLTAQKVAQYASATATWALATAQKALNAVMRMNPIALVVTAVAALVGGVIVAYKNFEGFRRVVDKAWESMKKFAMIVWNGLVKAFEDVKSAIAPVWSVLTRLLGIDNEAFAQTIDSTTSSTERLGEVSKKAMEGTEQFTDALDEQNSLLGINEMSLKDMTKQLNDLYAAEASVTISSANINKPDIKPLEGALKGVDIPAIQIPLQVEEGAIPTITQQVKGGLRDVQAAIIDIGKHVKDALNNILGNFGEALGESLAEGDMSGAFNAVLNSVLSALQAFGGALIAAGTAGLALQSLMWNPILAVGAGVALIAAASAAKAALQNAVKPMANGGIVYGTTFAMVGEYPGAANNPEVVAPLNKLKRLIQPAGAMQAGQVEFVISGRTLKGVLSKMNNIDNRTR